MNLCLVLINVYYLVKLNNTTVNYSCIKVSKDESVINHFLVFYQSDIAKCFPGIDLNFQTADVGYAILHEGTPVGLLLGKKESDDNVDILLDYSVPSYRDFSIGKYLYSKLPEDKIKSLTFRGSDENHKAYLAKMNFVKTDDYYKKVL